MKRLLLCFIGVVLCAHSTSSQTADDPNEGTRLIPLGGNNFQFTWWGRAGNPYLVEFSDDLLTWTYINTLFSGADAVSPPVMFNSVSGDRLYVRLQTDPFYTDTDGDGIPDGWEIQHGLNPRNPADALTLSPGGLSYLAAYQLGIDPNDPLQGASPAAPVGVHVTFPDAALHPADPDLSQIRVAWNAPAETGVTVTLGQTYAGDPGEVFAPVALSSPTQSVTITGLLSKRIHEFRVTFKGPNDKTSSTDISYEVPVIRGLMHRRTLGAGMSSTANTFLFPGMRLYGDGTYTGVPRKFASYLRTWNYTTDGGDEYRSGSESVSYNFSSRNFSWTTEDHTIRYDAGGNETGRDDATYSLTGTEPAPGSPIGGATEAYTDDSTGSHESSTTRVLNFTLQPHATLTASGAYAPPWPFLSIESGSKEYGDYYDVPNHMHYPWTETPTLVSDASGQHIQWTGNNASYVGKGSYTPPTNFATHVPGGTTISDTGGTVSWTRPFSGDYSYSSETVTLTGEMSTQALVNASAPDLASMSSLIPWYIPYGTVPKKDFTNQYAIDGGGLSYYTTEASPWLQWDYDTTYTSGTTGWTPSLAGYPQNGHVTVPVNWSAAVGQYRLEDDESYGRLLSSEYKYRFYPPAEDCTISWLERFYPDSPIGTIYPPEYKVRTYAVTAGQSTDVMPDADRLIVDRTEAWSTPAAPAAQGAAAPPVIRREGTVGTGPLVRVMRWDPFDQNVEDNKMVTEIDGNGSPVKIAWMPGKGSRIFPDKATPTGFIRPSCYLYIKGVPNKTVYLKSFDVDDATPEAFDKDPNTGQPVIDTNGRAGNDNRSVDPAYLPTGSFPAATTSATRQILLDANGEASVFFIATMCPGDNFRVAMSENAADLNLLQVSNSAGAGYIAPDSDQQPFNFPGLVSPMLTVWRRLYLEIDSMDAVPSPREAPDEAVAVGNLWSTNSAGGLTLLIGWEGTNAGSSDEDFYKDGTVSNGTLTLNVTGSTHNTLTVKETLTQAQKDSFIIHGLRVKDDDDKYLAELGLTPILPKGSQNGEIVSGIMAKFAPAYIQVRDANALGMNPRTIIPFKGNAEWDIFGNSHLTAAKDLTDAPDFWTHELIFAYQAKVDHDNDPTSDSYDLGKIPKNSQLLGGSSFGWSAIFLECIRESAIGNPDPKFIRFDKGRYRKTYINELLGAIAHELGHSPGGQTETSDHNEEGLMKVGAAPIDREDFSPPTVLRFRKATKWRK